MRTAQINLSWGVMATITLLLSIVMGTTSVLARSDSATVVEVAPREAATVVIFPDGNLEIAIRNTLQKPTGDITSEELAGLRRLDANNENADSIGITNLSGIEYCINLTSLLLYGNNITDISSLSGLVNLTELTLRGNKVSDISPLANLTSLSALYLDKGNTISDISPLSNLIRLEYLYLGDNQIEDISVLASHIHLKELRLENNRITDISVLISNNGLGQGDELWLQGNPLDLSEGSAARSAIETFVARGINVRHDTVPAGTSPITSAPTQSSETDSDSFWTVVWWIFGIVVVLGMALRLFGTRRRKSRWTGITFWIRHDDDDD